MNLARNQENSQTSAKQTAKSQSDTICRIRASFKRPSCKKAYVINYMVNQYLFFKGYYFEAEETIARKLGVSLATVKRAVRDARIMGIFFRKRRYDGIKTLSNLYTLNPLLKIHSVIQELANILPALRNILCLSMLLPSMSWCQKAANATKGETDTLYSHRSYLLTRPEPDPDLIKSTARQSTGLKTGKRLGLGENEIKKEEKILKREVCSPLNNEQRLVMNYPFLQTKAQRSADLLGLTIAGATRIAKYSEEAHAYAFKTYCESGKVRRQEIADPLRYYISVCNRYCRDNQLAIDYGADNRLMMQYKISDSDELYLPEDQRVQVEMPTQKTEKATAKSPYPTKPLPSTLHLASNARIRGHQDEPLDNIEESIKAEGYKAAGIMSEKQTYWSTFFPKEVFHDKAVLQIESIIENNETYVFDVKAIYDYVNKSIEIEIERNQLTIDVELAKIKAHEAMAAYMPTVLSLLKDHVVLAKGV